MSYEPNDHNELSIANWMSQITDIIPSGHEMISHQSEQNQYGYPQLQHASSQGEPEVDDNLDIYCKWLFNTAEDLLLAPM